MKRHLLVATLVLCSQFVFGQALDSVFYRQYGTQQYNKDLLAQDTAMQQNRSAIERHTFDFLYYGLPDTVLIPVVFHLVGSASANLTMDDVEVQMDLLNKDFYLPEFLTTETSHEAWVAEGFSERAAKPSIFFCLATHNPSGGLTQGVVYVSSQVDTFAVGTDITTTTGGGSLAWNTANYLNIWVAPLENDVAGFAQMPGGPASSDGVVINTAFVAREDTAFISANPNLANYAGGRTLSHLIGSYLNLYELWNDDQPCADDNVMDTPIHNAPNYDKPGYRHVSTCDDNPVEMTMNLMDNTDDEAQFMFTNGQMMRMYATLDTVVGGPRAGLRTLSSQCGGGGIFVQGNFGEPNEEEDETATGKLTVQVYPNPASDGFTIIVSSPCEEEVKLTSFTQLGNVQHSQTVDGMQVGQANTVYVSSRDWPPGMYLIRAQCGKETASVKLLLER